MTAKDLPGIVVGVVADQQLVWSAAFGQADRAAKRPMTTDTQFRMASHSKLFTATAIMQLREQGKVRLDDPVAKYLPWFQVKPAAPDDPPITVEDLLTHASGLPREAGSHWTTMQFPTREELQKLMPNRQAAFSPEERWKYSNLAYTLAGMIVEAVSGETWAQYLQKHIFDPLAMNASSVDRPVPGLAVGYGRRMPDGSREVMPFVDARGMAPATGLTSTVGDMAKFVSARFRRGKMGGNQLLSTGSLREMHRVRMLETTWTQGYAVGFSVRRDRDKLYVGHGGSYPGYLTQTYFRPDSKVGVIVLTNAQDAVPSDIAMQLFHSVGEAVARATAAPAKPAAWDPAWSRFAGIYRSRSGETQVVELNQRLVLLTLGGPSLENPTTLQPLGNGTFRYTAPTGGSPVGEVVRFEEEGGQVVRMFTGDSFSRRIN
jgi:D-alanyl-D-alanine carboxypeptidase